MLPLTLGLLGSAMVRPHITALNFTATFAGFLFRRDIRRTALTPLNRAIALGILLVVGLLIAGRTEAFFDVESVSSESAGAVLNDTESRTAGGASDFDAQPVSSPADKPGAVLTVLFRPFPWEADNFQGLAASAEGVLLLGLAVASRGRLRNIWRYRPGRAYVVLCLAYSAMFIYAFSTFSSFGLLARERVQVYPFVLVLLCLPSSHDLRRRRALVAPPPATREVPPR